VTSLISMTPLHVAGTKPWSLNGSISDLWSIVRNNSWADEAAFENAIPLGATVVMAVAATITAKMTVMLHGLAVLCQQVSSHLTRHRSRESGH
jgi:hypothetical protein